MSLFEDHPMANRRSSAPEHVFNYAPFCLDGDLQPVFTTGLGALFRGDCLAVLPRIRDGSVDTIFADPPFNLGKDYGHNTDDLRPDDAYLDWCRRWLAECVRILRPGGSLFVYHLPKRNILLGAHLVALGMDFRHWIAVEMSTCLPIDGRLHPSHYSLLYFSMGQPNTFQRIRTPVRTCRHCGGEIKDYGGHRGALNPNGITLKDVWTDITPVRHRSFKSEDHRANALSTKLLDRVVEMSTAEGDLVFDPFGGSGTTFRVCEKKGRRWIGIEIEPEAVAAIVARLSGTDVRDHENDDFVEEAPRRGRRRAIG
jgi:site-specific DNA-methyltransferase (adenine-specific)